MIQPTPKVERLMPVVDPEAAHLEADAKAEARQAAEIVYRKLPPHEVVVAYPQPKILLGPDEELPVEDEMPEEVVEPKAGFTLLGLLLAQEKDRWLRVGVVVKDVPAVEVAVDDRKAEGQVTQFLGDADLNLEGQWFGVAIAEIRQLPAHIAEYHSSHEVARGIEVGSGGVHSQAKGTVTLHLRGDHLEVGTYSQPFGHPLAGAEVDGVLGSLECTDLLPPIVGLGEVAVGDVLYAEVGRQPRAFQVVGVAGVAVADTRYVEAMVDRNLLVHALVQSRRIA